MSGRRGRKPKTVEEKPAFVEEPMSLPAVRSIAVDLDGTLANTQESVLRRLGTYSGIEVVDSWEFFHRFGERFWEAYKHAWMNFEDIKPTDPTIGTTTRTLMENGCLVDVVTCRDEALQPYTERWLARNAVACNRLVVLPVGLDKVEATEYDLYVDDQPGLAEKHPSKVIVYDRPWNRGVAGVRRIRVLSELLDLIGL